MLDQLAHEGCKLESYYVQPLCSPTRSTSTRYCCCWGWRCRCLVLALLLPPRALTVHSPSLLPSVMTGRYPSHTGMGPDVIVESVPYGVPGREVFVAEYLKKAGYMTHAVGKWHLGMCDDRYQV